MNASGWRNKNWFIYIISELVKVVVGVRWHSYAKLSSSFTEYAHKKKKHVQWAAVAPVARDMF